MDNRKWLLVTAMMILSVLPVTALAVRVSEHCINDTHIGMSFVFDLTAGGNTTAYNYTQVHMCVHNCSNDKCMGTSPETDLQSVWSVYGVGIVLLVLGIILGMPFGKMTGQENIKPGFNTTLVVKYLFFFIGLFLMYLALSMSHRLSMTYGGEENMASAGGTATMVIMLTILLFLFIFVIEFFFYTLKWWQDFAERKKWGTREEEEG